tara:strand:- start:740 stop:1090 length:351 start_codon:yes stop_codon:yes gene_type:complete
MLGGEIYVKKIPSIKVLNIAKVVAPDASHKIIGIRPGEKLHEQMISTEDAPHTFEYKDYYKILPALNNLSKDQKRIGKGLKVDDDFTYSSEKNRDWMEDVVLQDWIEENQTKIEGI